MKNKGRVEVITGCMFSGKTEELARRIRRAEIAHQRAQVFNSALDIRFAKNSVSAHSGCQLNAVMVQNSSEILSKIKDDTQVVAIDEAQFFDKGIVNVINTFAEKGLRVIVVGLDTNFRGEPFGPMPLILAMAEQVDKLTAICMVCGEEATRTQRIINGQPANYGDEVIVVGADEKYEARCRTHHQVPGKSILKANKKMRKIDYKDLDSLSRDALNKAEQALSKSYSPYSGFYVSAALFTDNGVIITGNNFENVSIGLTICAERAAVARANAMGIRQFKGIAVIGKNKDSDIREVVSPCGACRQILYEVAKLSKRNLTVIMSNTDKSKIITAAISELLPLAFGLTNLGIKI